MTMMAYTLVAIDADDDPAQWRGRYGDDWLTSEEINFLSRDLFCVRYDVTRRPLLRERTPVRLDWGALLWEVSLQELREQIIGQRPASSGLTEISEHGVEAAQNELLDSLDPDGRYGFIAVELY